MPDFKRYQLSQLGEKYKEDLSFSEMAKVLKK
jgi:hypothetical protein